MYPHPQTRETFKYPLDRLLKLQGVLKEGEMRHPDMLDRDGECCPLVVKKWCRHWLDHWPRYWHLLLRAGVLR